jgi:hypothetical protein
VEGKKASQLSAAGEKKENFSPETTGGITTVANTEGLSATAKTGKSTVQEPAILSPDESRKLRLGKTKETAITKAHPETDGETALEVGSTGSEIRGSEVSNEMVGVAESSGIAAVQQRTVVPQSPRTITDDDMADKDVDRRQLDDEEASVLADGVAAVSVMR